MRKIIITLLAIIVCALFAQSAVIAANDDQQYSRGLPYAKPIYKIGNAADVYVFDDQDNKCYVVNTDFRNSNPTISSVKR